MGQQEKAEAHPLTVPTRVPPSCVDPGLLAQIVKAVMEGMTSSTTQEVPATQILQVASGSVVTTGSVVLLVRLVKSMREMGCELYLGEQDAKIGGRWIRKVEKIMI
jgi:hypothetical protein